MPRIRRIQIKNFRSIHSLDISIKDLSVFVGDNDCGKSNILRALNLFFNGKTNPYQDFDFRTDYNRYVEPIANKAPQIEVTLDLELPDSYHENNGQFVRWTKTWRAAGKHKDDYNGFSFVPKRRGGGFKTEFLENGIPPKSNAHTLLAKIEFEYIPAIRSAVFFRTLRGRIYKVISQVAEQGMRETSGDFEDAIAGYVDGLIEDITGQLGDDAKISMPNDLSNIFEQLDFLYSDKLISLDSRGDGIKARYIPLILKFIAQQKRALGVRGAPPHTFIWAYEEPENNLEFRRSQELADTFCKLSEDDLTQILLTTHSPVFYNLAKLEHENRSAIHVRFADGTSGTTADPADNLFDLDQHMGVMPIIAPHIARAEETITLLSTQTDELQRQLAENNPDNKPTVFVEGQSEFLLFSSLLERFRPEINEAIFLARPAFRAGASYVGNMLKAWECETKHLMPANRRKALGIVDLDVAGIRAKDQFRADVRNPSHTKIVTLGVPNHLERASEAGLKLPICLEHLWPHNIWELARDNGWLGPDDIRPKLSDQLLDQMINNGAPIENLVHHDDLVYLKNKPTDDHKIDWINHMIGLEDNELELFAFNFLALIDTMPTALRLVIV